MNCHGVVDVVVVDVVVAVVDVVIINSSKATAQKVPKCRCNKQVKKYIIM